MNKHKNVLGILVFLGLLFSVLFVGDIGELLGLRLD